jgi:hypothetical protein
MILEKSLVYRGMDALAKAYLQKIENGEQAAVQVSASWCMQFFILVTLPRPAAINMHWVANIDQANVNMV